MATDELPGFEYDRTGWRGSGDFTSPVHLVTGHTTEGAGLEGARHTLNTNGDQPHVLTEIRADAPGGRRKIQMVSLERAAKALRNAAGGVETNKNGTLQIELVGFAAHPTLPTADDYRWYGAEVVGPLSHAGGVPLVAPIPFHPYPPNFPLGREPWRTCPNGGVRGFVGHQHWVENVHGDPGDYSSRLFVNGTKSALDLIFEGASVHGPVVKPWEPPACPLAKGEYLHLGSKGEHVELWKIMLCATKYGQHLDMTPKGRATYGPGTVAATKALQVDCEKNAHLPITADGICGPQTWLWGDNILLVEHVTGRR